jgi:hypothetical protein
MEETMIAARKSLLLGLASLVLLSGLSGCIVVPRGGHRGAYVAEGPSAPQGHWNNGWQGGGGQGGGWNNHYN